ncbi:MAG TPA: type I glyceraldehyde-3-phosphate dehydrogenase [Thermoanaerobaculia bacterium]|nr:type I glyceraldehyde-3-phosphate dehydrogenase [Thermoanaerobaculia bacterium]
MTTSVGLVGLGRIGRNIFRILYKRDDIRVAAISEIADHKGLEYLLRFDTVLGRFPDEVSIKEGNLYVVGRQVPMVSEKETPQPAWGDLGVHTVIEATSKSRTRAELEKHLAAGAKRVISLAPPADALDLMAVMGVNDDKLDSRQRIVSNASSTVHAVTPVLKILNDAFGVKRAIFTTVHSYTSQHRLADVPAEDMRRGRAAAENIIPQESRSPRMVTELLPELAGKVTGYAMNVPVRNGSVVDLVCWYDRKVTPVAINEVVRTAAATDRWRKVVRYEDEPIVSADVVYSNYSSTFDSLATMVMGEHVSKTLCWYDAGYGYAHRAVELIQRYAELDGKGKKAA